MLDEYKLYYEDIKTRKQSIDSTKLRRLGNTTYIRFKSFVKQFLRIK